MNASLLSRFAPLTEGVHLLTLLLWGSLAIGLTVALGVLIVTRWGRSQPMRICIVLSLWAHVLLAGYAATVQIVAGAGPGKSTDSFEITIVESDDTYTREDVADPTERPWERIASGAYTVPEFNDPLPTIRDANLVVSRTPEQGVASLLEPAAITLPGRAPELVLPKAQPLAAPQIRQGESLEAPQQIDAPAPQKAVEVATVGPNGDEPARTPLSETVSTPQTLEEGPRTVMQVPLAPAPSYDLPKMQLPEAVLQQPAKAVTRPMFTAPAQALAEEIATTAAGETTQASNGGGPDGGDNASAQNADLVEISRALLTGSTGPTIDHELPNIYKLRTLEDRTEQAHRHGGSKETEAAVEAGLAWFVANQSRDGRWAPSELEGGRGRDPEGRDRQRAGARADTGITALAVLAFNGAGYTHREGKHQTTVARGLEFLIASQRHDGFLGGEATTYAAMYCHGMATLALSEAYAMTGDEALRPTVEKAIQFTLRSQNRTTGGWRYRPGDDGDTSQLGWQVMALKSAELAGIEIPENAKIGALRFIKSVSSGSQGELVAYRRGRRPSRAMTAEALVCRQFLSVDGDQIGGEAARYIVQDRPGMNKPNLYYWYYATLALYRKQGSSWERWNKDLQKTVVESQRQQGDLAGSWDPDTVWGGYGGRAYSTAMATLCLEVYYRFLPVYAQTTRGAKESR